MTPEPVAFSLDTARKKLLWGILNSMNDLIKLCCEFVDQFLKKFAFTIGLFNIWKHNYPGAMKTEWVAAVVPPQEDH